MAATVGEANCVSPRLSGLAERFGLADLQGRRLACCPDAHLGHGDKALATLELLKLVSGEDAIAVERKFKPSVTVRLRTRFALAVNELPKFGDHAGAGRFVERYLYQCARTLATEYEAATGFLPGGIPPEGAGPVAASVPAA